MKRAGWLTLFAGVVAILLSGCSHEEKPIVFIGDSIVQLWDIETTLPHLTAVNLGKSGSGVSYIEEKANSLGGHDVVAVMGINDLSHLSDDKLEGYVERYIEAFSRLGAVRIYLFEVLPTCNGSDGLNGRISRFNSLVNAALPRHPSIVHIPVYDQFMASGDSAPDPSLYIDGLHPGAEGYVLLSAALQCRLSSK